MFIAFRKSLRRGTFFIGTPEEADSEVRSSIPPTMNKEKRSSKSATPPPVEKDKDRAIQDRIQDLSKQEPKKVRERRFRAMHLEADINQPCTQSVRSMENFKLFLTEAFSWLQKEGCRKHTEDLVRI